MDMNKVTTAKIIRPSFENGVQTTERWAIDHSEEELSTITNKLQEMFDKNQLESTRSSLSNVGIDTDQITSVVYTFSNVESANEYVTFISQFNPVSIEIVS